MRPFPHSEDCQRGVAHLETIARLARELAASGIAVHEHQFHPHINASWHIILGTRTKALKCFWDARDQEFAIQEADLTDTPYGTVKMPESSDWCDLAYESVDALRGADPAEFLTQYVKARYAS